MKKTLIVLVIIPLFVGGVIGYVLGQRSEGGGGTSSQYADAPFEEAQPVSYQQRDSVITGISASRRNAITQTVAACSAAVVGINVIEVRQYRYRSPWSDDPFFRYFFPDQVYTQQVRELGSGFIISPDGYIVTNDHVAGNASEITVTMTNGEKYTAELIGSDRTSDIALLKIDGKNLPYLKLGNSDDVIVGEWVIAFGNPFGLFDRNNKPTVTVGVVSTTNISLQAQEGRAYRNMIQTDAAINSGNSGGPLVNSLGEVIGVNAVIYTPNQGNIGLGFAIPVNRVKAIVAELKRSGKIEREFYLGFEIQDVDQRVARYFGLDRAEGVIVSNVYRRSPAERAGLRPGDIILEVNGESVPDQSTLVSILEESRVGDVLRLKVLRDRRVIELALKLEKRPT
ncbi:MAG TPA: trypsin-like peptidase domain-containing protein [Bacteroidota bacterium]|nr:trypsin-like peptidase domain-containing protein [Bacteroidota bacterium]